jgi:hypothetical protein
VTRLASLSLCGLLALSGCLSRTEIGTWGDAAVVDPHGTGDGSAGDAMAESDAADVAPTELFRDDVVGTWCGAAAVRDAAPWLRQDTEVRLTFRDDGTYRVECAFPPCEPFQGEPVDHGGEGRYWITDVTLNGLGWGEAEDVAEDGSLSRVTLDKIDIDMGDDGEEMTLERHFLAPTNWWAFSGQSIGVVDLALSSCEPL